MGLKPITRTNCILLFIAAVFHLVGIVGIGFLHNKLIANSTPFHLLLMLTLILASMSDLFKTFFIWSGIVAIGCFAAEWIGVHYTWLFGSYWYGDALGLKLLDIPLLIGVNWIVVIAGAISIAEKFTGLRWLIAPGAATIATTFDFLLEPVAIRLGYWTWQGGQVPAYNYLCWWLLSFLCALLWQRLKLRGNFFAAGLFGIQTLFFILLRMLL